MLDIPLLIAAQTECNTCSDATIITGLLATVKAFAELVGAGVLQAASEDTEADIEGKGEARIVVVMHLLAVMAMVMALVGMKRVSSPWA